jgi:hypothetical protein
MSTKKITELTNLATPVGADVLPIVDDVAGTATTKKVTATNLMTLAPVQSVAGQTGTVTLSNTDISGLGTAATQDVGTSNGNVVQLDSTGLPAVDGSQLTNLPSSPLFYSIVSETTTARTLSDSDNGKVIVCSNSGQVTITVPSGLTSGFNCTITQGGAGTVSIVGSGATINGFNNKTATAGQYAVINIIPVGTNAYYVDGDLTNAPLINTYALDFDGTNDSISGSGTSMAVYSMSMWFYNDVAINTSSTGQVLMSPGGYDFGIVLGNQTGLTNELISTQYGSGAFGYTGSGISLNVGWHHIMISWVSSSSTNSGSAGYDFWLDGTLVGNDSTSPPSSPFNLNATAFYLGARGGNYRYFNGKIDEFAIWGSDVSADISTIYNSGVPANLDDTSVVSTAPSIWWRMGDNDGGTGSTVTDQGTLGIDATINGATFVTDTP